MNGAVRSKGFHTTFNGKKVFVPPALIMSGTKAWELYHSKKPVRIVPGAETLEHHLAEMDAAFRKLEGRKPALELDEREQMLEGIIPWNPMRLTELTTQHLSIRWCTDERTPQPFAFAGVSVNNTSIQRTQTHADTQH